jgi:CRISPR-associated endonuclease Cas1
MAKTQRQAASPSTARERRRARYQGTKKVDRPQSPLWTKAQLQNPDDLGIHVATGYGIRVGVERGHLVVEDGIADERRRVRFNRATSRLKRLVVVGRSGSVSLEALRWIVDVGAVFVQIDHDSNLVTMSAPARHHEPALRRAQALAAGSEVGRQITAVLLGEKLDRQAALCERIEHLTGAVGSAEIIRAHRERLTADLSLDEMREAESSAGRTYWQAWAKVPVRISDEDRPHLPEHWRLAGPRTSRRDGHWPRRATTPAHAMLNYLYAILEVEATIAAHASGLDPSLGILHADQRYRTSLAADLMEPTRPLPDGTLFSLLAGGVLSRNDVVETADGTCRLAPRLAALLALQGPSLLAATTPHASLVARLLTHPRALHRARQPKPTPSDHPPPLGDPVQDPATWDALVSPELRKLRSRVISERTGISLTSVRDLCSGQTFPRRSNRITLAALVRTSRPQLFV